MEHSEDQPFDELWCPKTPPPLVTTGSPSPAASGKPLTISVDAEKPLRKVSPSIFSNNAAVWLGKDYLLHGTMKQRLRDAEIGLLRFPGGSRSAKYHWDGKYPPYAGPVPSIGNPYYRYANPGNTVALNIQSCSLTAIVMH